MAERPVFLPSARGDRLVETISIAFTWHGGFAVSQKRKNVVALHEGAAARGLGRLLEASRRSQESLGRALSAFALMTTAEKRPCTVECAFQGSKVFAEGGPFTDLYGEDSRAAKRDDRLRTSGALTGFAFGGSPTHSRRRPRSTIGSTSPPCRGSRSCLPGFALSTASRTSSSTRQNP